MNLTNMVVGFAVQSVLAALLGISSLSDDFQVAWAVVTFGAVTFLTMVTSVLVPHMHAPGTSRIPLGGLWIVPVAGTAIAVVQCATGAIWPDRPALSAILIWSAPSVAFASVAAIAQAVAFIQRRFALAALGAIANGGGMLVWLLVFGGQRDPKVLGLGLAFGYFVQLIATLLPFCWNRPSVLRQRAITVRAFIGVTLFTLAAKFQPVVERLISVALASGAATALGFGQKVAQGLLLVASFGLAATATAALTSHVRSSNHEEAGHLLAKIVGGTFVLSSITVTGAIPLIYPVCKLLFERGSFTSEDTLYVSNVVLLQLPWVVASALAGTLTSYLYVERRYLRVLGASAVGIAVMTAGSLLVATVAPSYAVAAGSSLAAAASLTWIVRLTLKSEASAHWFVGLREIRELLLCSVALVCATAISYLSIRIVYPPESIVSIIVPLVVAAVFTIISSRVRVIRRGVVSVMSARM